MRFKSLCGFFDAVEIDKQRVDEAIECFEKAYSIRLETLGAEHKDTVAIKSKLDEIK